MTTIWILIKKFFSWLWGVLVGIIKKIVEPIVEKQFVKWLLALGWKKLLGGAASALILGWLSAPRVQSVISPESSYSPDTVIASMLRQALANGEKKNSVLDDRIEALTKTIQDADVREQISRLEDSVSRLHETISRLSIGSGTVNVSGGGKTLDGKFQDPWLLAFITPDSALGIYLLNYNLTFDLKTVDATITRANGTQDEVYSVYIKSLTNPSQTKYLGDFRKQSVYQIEQPKDDRQLYWRDLTLHLDLDYVDGIKGGLCVTPFTWSSGGLEPKSVIARFPELGFATDAKGDAYLTLGARVNIAHWIPVFKDLALSAKYGVGPRGSAIIFGVGTSL